MKHLFFSILCICCLLGCNTKPLTPKETVTKYYLARNVGDFKALKECVNDSITITEGDYVMPYNTQSFYEVYKWDSIFQPTYEIVSLAEKEGEVLASITINSLRNSFLKNSNMTCDFKFSFEDQKISKIATMDCANANWAVWQKERDSLVNWISQNHPRLNGFINDMTMKGALNYLEAITLYEAKENIERKED